MKRIFKALESSRLQQTRLRENKPSKLELKQNYLEQGKGEKNAEHSPCQRLDIN